MERIWLKSYPEGVPAQVDVNAFSSIVDMFEKSVAEFADRAAYVHMGATLTYAEVDRLSRDFAAFLHGDLKLPKGARVALMMPNVLQYPIALFGALRGGYAVVNCNPLYTPRELERQLTDCGAETVLVLENFACCTTMAKFSRTSTDCGAETVLVLENFAIVVQQALSKTMVRHVITTQLGDMLGWGRGTLVNFVAKYIKRLVPKWSIANTITFSDALRKGASLRWLPEPIEPHDIAFLQYTGGTTGVPKGAMLTHRNIIANLQQHHAQIRPALYDGHDIVVTALPLFHIYALTVSCLLAVKIGATNVLITNPRDTRTLVKELGKHRFTCLPGVNTLFKALVDDPAFARLDFSSLRIAAAGGAPLQEAVAKKWQAITGKTLIEAYGLTETSPVVTCNPVNLSKFNGSCGVPIPSTEVAIRDERGGDLPIGEAGELCVRGPQVMKGYWNKPEETAKVMMPDNFLRTGDIATIDGNGFVRIVDRKKDMINVSGLKVYPNEVEEVASMHPGVLEAGAVGVPNAFSGEAVKIVVVKRDPTLTAADLKAHCQKHLTSYKVPHVIEFRKELPKTTLGKILRRALRDAPPA